MKKPIYKKWWFWVIIVVVVIGALSAGGDKDVSTTTGDANSGQEQSEEKSNEDVVTPEITVTAKEVIEAFEANEVKGKQTYTGKVAEITGVVGTIGEGLSQTYITLNAGGEFDIISLQCYLDDEAEITKAAELNKGDTVTVIGTIGEKSLNISVKKCKIK